LYGITSSPRRSRLVPIKAPRQFLLETALESIEDDELVEITPKAIRLRKIYLKENDRKRQERAARGGQ
jgi:GTP-binding protein